MKERVGNLVASMFFRGDAPGICDSVRDGDSTGHASSLEANCFRIICLGSIRTMCTNNSFCNFPVRSHRNFRSLESGQ